MKVLNQNVLVKVETKDKSKEAGVITWPDSLESEGLMKAVVVAVSPELSEKLSEGDILLIYKNAGKTFTHPETKETLRVVNISEIVVVL